MEMKLFYMGEINGMTSENIHEAEKFITACELIILATNNREAGVRLSLINNLPGQTMNEIYFATDTHTQKVSNLWEDPVSEVLFTNGMGQVILSGKAVVVTDMEVKKSKWHDYMVNHFPDGVDGNSFCLIRFKPSEARVMLM